MTVFAVLAHGDPSTFIATSEILRPSRVVVHVDTASDAAPFAVGRNVTLTSIRHRVHWGGFSVVEATLDLYREALEQCNSGDEYIVLLSGECVPVRRVHELERHFRNDPGRLYCRAGLLLDGRQNNENRVLRRWHFDRFDARTAGFRGRANAVARRFAVAVGPRRKARDFSGMTVVAGSQWTALTADVVRELLDDAGNLERATSLLRHSLAPDEIFFHTLIHSREWGARTFTPQPTAKAERRTADFANLHHIDRSLTKYLDVAAIERAAREGKFFARKVRVRNDWGMRAALDRLGGTPRPESTGE